MTWESNLKINVLCGCHILSEFHKFFYEAIIKDFKSLETLFFYLLLYSSKFEVVIFWMVICMVWVCLMLAYQLPTQAHTPNMGKVFQDLAYHFQPFYFSQNCCVTSDFDNRPNITMAWIHHSDEHFCSLCCCKYILNINHIWIAIYCSLF